MEPAGPSQRRRLNPFLIVWAPIQYEGNILFNFFVLDESWKVNVCACPKILAWLPSSQTVAMLGEKLLFQLEYANTKSNPHPSRNSSLHTCFLSSRSSLPPFPTPYFLWIIQSGPKYIFTWALPMTLWQDLNDWGKCLLCLSYDDITNRRSEAMTSGLMTSP